MNDKYRVIIADDMPFMRNLLASILTMGGYTVVAEATGGAEAVELYRRHRPAIVVVDAVMPGMGGFEAAQGIIAMDAGARVVLSIHAGEEELELPEDVCHALAGVIRKPYLVEEVMEAMQKALG